MILNGYRNLPAINQTRAVGLVIAVCSLTACLGWGADAPPSPAPPSAPVRLAVLAEDVAPETLALTDLLTVEISKLPGVETVERAELGRVLREQALTAAGLADGVEGRVAIGRLLRADGFVFVGRTGTGRQLSARLVEARRGFQVVQMLYATNETPTAVAERIAGIVKAKHPTLRLPDEQRILLNVIRLGNATLDPRANWIGTDGVLMLASYLAAHPAVLTVERRELGTLLDETLSADVDAPKFRAADFLIDGDVFLTPAPDRMPDEPTVTLVLRMRNMQLAEQARVIRTGNIAQLEALLSEAAAGILEEATIRRPAVEGGAHLESRFLRAFGLGGMQLWATEAAYALDGTNSANRRALVNNLLYEGKCFRFPFPSTPEQDRIGLRANAQFLVKAVDLIQQDPDLLKDQFITRWPMASVLASRHPRGARQSADQANERELREILRPVRARARFEIEQNVLKQVGEYPTLCRNLHLIFEDLTESTTFLQTLIERSANDAQLKPLERRNRTAVFLSCSTLPPRLYDNLCTNEDPVIRFFTHVKASRISASADEREHHDALAADLLPAVLQDVPFASFFASLHSRCDVDHKYNFLRNALVYVKDRNTNSSARVRAALQCQCEAWLDSGDLAALCDTWSDQYFGWLDQAVGDSLLDRCQAAREAKTTRLPRSRHGQQALERIDSACAELARRRQENMCIAQGDKLVMLFPRDGRLRDRGFPLWRLDFAATPQRLLVDGDQLWIAFGGYEYGFGYSASTEYTGLMRMDLTCGKITSLRFETYERDWTKFPERNERNVYLALSPMFFWKDKICFARRGRGVYLLPRDVPAATQDFSGGRLLDLEAGLPSDEITGVAALDDTLYIALPTTLLAWKEGLARPRIVAVTATETAPGQLASTGAIDGLVADPATRRLYLFAEGTIWRFSLGDASWTRLASGDSRVSTTRNMHGIIASNPGLIVFTTARPKSSGLFANASEAYVNITGCFRLADESVGAPPVELTTPKTYLARYDLAQYRGGTIVIGGYYNRRDKQPDWELAYLVGATNRIDKDMPWLAPPDRPQQPTTPKTPQAVAARSPDNSPLVAAVLANDSETISRVLDAGAVIDAYDLDGMTPLAHAAGNGKTEAVRALIARGADIDVPNGQGWTPLMLAARNSHQRCVNLLLAAGADSRHRDNSNFPVLQRAIHSNDPGILRALMEAGADPLESCGAGKCVIDFAVNWVNADMLQLGTLPGALEVARRPSPFRLPPQMAHTSRVDLALARLRQGQNLTLEEQNAGLIAFSRYNNEMCRKHNCDKPLGFTEPDRTDYYIQAVKMSFIDWQRHGGRAFRSEIRETSCLEIEKRLAKAFDPFLAFCTIFQKVQLGETEAARRDFERIKATDHFLAQHVIQWSFRDDKQMAWLIEPYLASGGRDKVRQLAILVRQAETPEMQKIAADLYRRIGDQKEADALLARADTLEAK